MVTLPQKKEAVEAMVSSGLSERADCRLVDLNRSTCRYESARQDDSEQRKQIISSAHAHRRFGYHAKVKKRGFAANHKRIYRIYCEEKLKRRRKKSKTLSGFAGAQNDVGFEFRMLRMSSGLWTSFRIRCWAEDAFARGTVTRKS